MPNQVNNNQKFCFFKFYSLSLDTYKFKHIVIIPNTILVEFIRLAFHIRNIIIVEQMDNRLTFLVI